MKKFLARQPIFDRSRAVYGYELLFRTSEENRFPNSPLDLACATTADNLFLFGVENLTQGRQAFINCSREFLLQGYASLLPKDRVVLEILETVKIDREVVDLCRDLKKSGYSLALDDFVARPEWEPLVAIADFIKMDALSSSPEVLRRMPGELARPRLKFLAEKVETYEDFQRLHEWGYSFFQGYFFSRPQMLSRHDVPASKLNYLRILQATNRADIDIDEVAARIKTETALSYRLLRYLNSPAFYLTWEIRSIGQALLMLGEQGIRKWVSLMAVACLGQGKPDELLTLPLIRARFCELLGPLTGMKRGADDLFLLGLFSLLDAMLDMEMSDVLKEITIQTEIRDALLGKKNKYREVFDLALLYESGSWDNLPDTARELGMDADNILDLYVQAVDWSQSLARAA